MISEEKVAALKVAYRFLAARERFSQEIRLHLAGKGHDDDAVEYVVQFLEERKLINDNKTTQALIERNSGKRSVGLEKLRAELERLGAPENAVEQSLAAMDETETNRAVEALRAKYKSGTERAKAGRFLYGRGFAEEAIESALDAFCGSETFPE